MLFSKSYWVCRYAPLYDMHPHSFIFNMRFFTFKKDWKVFHKKYKVLIHLLAYLQLWLHEFPFLLTMVLRLDSFILKWWETTAADLNLWYTTNSLTFSCNVMTFLCFLESFTITSGNLYGSHGVIQGLRFYFKCDEKYSGTSRNHFFPLVTIYWRDKLLTWAWLASHSLLSRYSNTWAHCKSNRKYYKIIIVLVFITVNFYAVTINIASLYLFLASLCLELYHVRPVSRLW